MSTSTPRGCLALAAAGVGLLAAALLLEGGTRLFFPPQLHQLRGTGGDNLPSLYVATPFGARVRPNQDVIIEEPPLSHARVRIRTNALGFRGDSVPDPSSSAVRILMVGDSITFGEYVEEPDTIPALLESFLRSTHPRVQVFNAGLPGSDLATERSILAQHMGAVRPHLVVVGSYLNDATFIDYLRPLERPWSRSAFLTRAYEEMGREAILEAQRERYADLLQNKPPAVPWTLQGPWMTSREQWQPLLDAAVMDWGLAWQERAWRDMEPLYEDVRDQAARQDAKLLVALFPVMFQVRASWDDRWPQSRFHALMDALRIRHVDLLDPMRAADAPDRDLYYDHCHPTPKGNRVAARALADAIVAQGLLPPP